MNDLEDQLRSTLHQVRDQSGHSALSGPALRRKARLRVLRVRTGGAALVGAAAVTGVVVAPSLIGRPASRSGQGVGGSVTPTARSAADPQKLAAGKAQPSASFSGKPTPSAPATPTGKPTPSAPATPTGTKAPADGVWDPAGSLIANPTVLAVAPEVAATDSGWTTWSKGVPLLDKSTAKVVFADKEPIDSTWRQYPRPLVLVTGRTAPDSPATRIAALTTDAGGPDSTNLQALTVDAMTTVAADGPQAIAVADSFAIYAAAEAGIDHASFTYRDATGEHTASMKVAGGVATALLPSADVKGTGNAEITRVTAYSHGKVVWDAAPVAGR